MSDKLAFPVEDTQQFSDSGMTLRDYFAAKAMQSFICQSDHNKSTMARNARLAYEQADEMLIARQIK